MSRTPKYCKQKVAGKADKAFCRVDGERVYLGVYGSPASWTKYAEVIDPKPKDEAEAARSIVLAAPPTLAEVMAKYIVHVDVYYGHRSAMFYHVRSFMRGLKTMFGEIPADEFRALKLQELREHWIAQGWTRRYVNEHVGRLKRMFRWAVSREMVAAETLLSLQSVGSLRTGKTKAPDKPPVAPVSDADVEATFSTPAREGGPYGPSAAALWGKARRDNSDSQEGHRPKRRRLDGGPRTAQDAPSWQEAANLFRTEGTRAVAPSAGVC